MCTEGLMRKFFIFVLMFMLVSACTRSVGVSATLPPQQSNPVEAVSPTSALPTEPFTPAATATFAPTTIPMTATPVPGTPPPTPTTGLPGDVPLKTWRDIPIMPGAITGEEAPDRYRFLITASVENVRTFYKAELPALGYQFSADGTGENGAPISVFTRGSTFLSVSMIVLGDLVVVTLAPI
jgi:hypothetical protein